MKKSLLFAFAVASLSVPVQAQQTNIYSVCTNYQENYAPGYYDQYGNYVQGRVNTERYNVQCGTGTYYRPNGGNVYQSPTQQPGRYCSPARTTLGGLLGGGIAAAVSKQDAYGWAIPLGAVLGMGASQSGCY